MLLTKPSILRNLKSQILFKSFLESTEFKISGCKLNGVLIFQLVAGPELFMELSAQSLSTTVMQTVFDSVLDPILGMMKPSFLYFETIYLPITSFKKLQIFSCDRATFDQQVFECIKVSFDNYFQCSKDSFLIIVPCIYKMLEFQWKFDNKYDKEPTQDQLLMNIGQYVDEEKRGELTSVIAQMKCIREANDGLILHKLQPYHVEWRFNIGYFKRHIEQTETKF